MKVSGKCDTSASQFPDNQPLASSSASALVSSAAGNELASGLGDANRDGARHGNVLSLSTLAEHRKDNHHNGGDEKESTITGHVVGRSERDQSTDDSHVASTS